MKKKGIKLFSLIISTMVFICNISFVKAEETSAYAYSDSATSNGVTLKVEWNEPVLGEPTTFHVSATGGSGIYKFNMETPSYTNPDELAYESVADPSRGEWTKYTSECESQDYTFTMMATGTYNFRFHVMDTKAGVTYLRTNTYIQVSSPNYPSVNSIVQNAVTRCNSETNGSDYSKALWLHDWLLEQLDYDNSLKWSSAESALTRSSGTCQAYERAYAKLLSAAGIENAETRDTHDGHTWNAMKLDGKWYQVDCTWDDSSENYYNFNRTHLYFALSDELMAIAHQGHNKIYTVGGYATPSNSLEHNYFVQNGDAQQWVESYRNRIQENLNNKNTEFSIQADNSTYPPSIYGIQNGIIAYVMNQNEWFVNGKKVELVAKTNDIQFDFTVTYPVECTNHDWDEGVITTEPTCTTKGVKTFTCNNCKTTKTEEVNALGHDYSKEWTIDKKATCTEEGSKSHHCTRCDSKKDVTIISKTSHNYDEGVITKEATKTETGIKTYTCKDCKTTKTEVIPIRNDDFNVDSESPVIDVSSVKLSTKTATKGDTVTFSVRITDNVRVNSSLIYVENLETEKKIFIHDPKYDEKNDVYIYSMKIDETIPNGHWRVAAVQADDAVGNVEIKTFIQNEYMFVVKDSTTDSEAPVIDVNSVKLSTKTATKGDTVTFSVRITDNVGVKSSLIYVENLETKKEIFIHDPKYDEKNDVYIYSIKIDETIPNGHWRVAAVRADDAVGNVEIKTFIQNEYIFVVSRDNKDVHQWEEGEIVLKPTCTKEGSLIYTCSICKATKTEVLKALGHDYSKDWTIDKKATCTEPGSKSHHCTRCDSKSDVTVIPVLSHNYDNGVITTSPTCTKSGVKTYTCKDCKTTKTEVLKALGHDYSKEWTIDKKATCKESGSKSHHCTRCDSKSDVTVISKLSHNWVLTSTVNPTRDHEGKKVYTCNLCKETKEESIPKLVGKWVSNSVGKWYEYSDGTYENSGFKKIENETYYFTSNGYVKTGWLSVNNNWYFFKNSGCMVTSNWVGSYYMDSEGKMKTNAFTPDGYYCGADGVYVRNAWVKHNGNYYYMDANGLMKKNAWVKDYYLGADGVMKTNTFTPDGYYVGSDGAYYRNRWIKYENKYYYANGAGLLVKNTWVKAYYLGADGVMKTNAFTPDGYYVGADGAYLRNQKIQVDGKEYYLNAAGKVARNQWVGDYFIDVNGNVVKNHWAGNYWCGADGRYVKSSWVDDGRYYVGSNGVYVINQWIGDYYLNGADLVTKNAWVGNYWCGSDGKYVRSSWVDNNQYYVGANGVYVPGRWVAYGSRWCYYAGSVYAKDITLNINGTAYTFDSNGYMK